MVHGIEKIKEYIGQYPDQYCIIGGTACDIIMEDIGMSFRATKDMDVVLIAENISIEFCKSLWKMVEDGGYETRIKGNDKKELYRFLKPKNAAYPYMIELFSRKPVDFEISKESLLTPIHIDDDIISLSAILLNDEYYMLFSEGRKNVDGVSVLDEAYLVLFKMRAYMDLKQRAEQGEKQLSGRIKKHKNDTFRLLAIVQPDRTVEVSERIKEDIKKYIIMVGKENVDLKNLGLKSTSLEDMIELITSLYKIN